MTRSSVSFFSSWPLVLILILLTTFTATRGLLGKLVSSDLAKITLPYEPRPNVVSGMSRVGFIISATDELDDAINCVRLRECCFFRFGVSFFNGRAKMSNDAPKRFVDFSAAVTGFRRLGLLRLRQQQCRTFETDRVRSTHKQLLADQMPPND